MTTKRNQPKSVEKLGKLLPIVIVPDKTYIDDTGNLIPTNIILVADLTAYEQLSKLLED